MTRTPGRASIGWLIGALVVLLIVAAPASAAKKSELVVRSVSAPASVNAGATFSAIDVIRNVGDKRAERRSRVAYRLSTRSRARSGAIALRGGRTVPRLKPATRSRGRSRLTVPAAAKPGSYFLIACTARRNHCRAAARKLTVNAPVAPVRRAPATPARPRPPRAASGPVAPRRRRLIAAGSARGGSASPARAPADSMPCCAPPPARLVPASARQAPLDFAPSSSRRAARDLAVHSRIIEPRQRRAAPPMSAHGSPRSASRSGHGRERPAARVQVVVVQLVPGERGRDRRPGRSPAPRRARRWSARRCCGRRRRARGRRASPCARRVVSSSGRRSTTPLGDLPGGGARLVGVGRGGAAASRRAARASRRSSRTAPSPSSRSSSPSASAPGADRGEVGVGSSSSGGSRSKTSRSGRSGVSARAVHTCGVTQLNWASATADLRAADRVA